MSLEDDLLAKLKSENAKDLQNLMLNAEDNKKTQGNAALFSKLSDYAAAVQSNSERSP